MQCAVEDLLKTFENPTHNNYPPTDTATTVNNYPTLDANAAAAAADNNVVTDATNADVAMRLAAVNQTQNNYDTASTSHTRRGDSAAVKRVPSYQRHNQNQSAANATARAAVPDSTASRTSTVRRSGSQTGARRGRSLSVVAGDRQRSVSNVWQGTCRRGLRSSQTHLCRRSLSSSASSQRQQQQQPGSSDRPSRQTSHQLIAARRRSHLTLTA